MRKLAIIVGSALILGALIASVVAYFVTSTDPITKLMVDGFGRPLAESPWWMRLFFGQERMWAGGKWFLVDLVWFWGSIGLGATLCAYGTKK